MRKVFLEVSRISKVRIAFVDCYIIWIIPLLLPLKPEITIDGQEECVFMPMGHVTLVQTVLEKVDPSLILRRILYVNRFHIETRLWTSRATHSKRIRAAVADNTINSMCLSTLAKSCKVTPYALHTKELVIAILIIDHHQLKGRKKEGTNRDFAWEGIVCHIH